MDITAEAITKVIADYTREAGVRNLEREIHPCAGKWRRTSLGGARRRGRTDAGKGKDKGTKAGKAFVVDAALVEKYLGVPRFRNRKKSKEHRVGSVTGLAWTSVGGDVERGCERDARDGAVDPDRSAR